MDGSVAIIIDLDPLPPHAAPRAVHVNAVHACVFMCPCVPDHALGYGLAMGCVPCSSLRDTLAMRSTMGRNTLAACYTIGRCSGEYWAVEH